jgi:hypothetical protein
VYFSFIVPVVYTPRVSIAYIDIPIARVGIPVDNIPIIVLGAPRAII